nr:PREDICTED: endogenous retrovirus group K member 11 Pol protein-like [Apteryx mantelli mantelli]
MAAADTSPPTLKITWKTDEPVWVEQWPLQKEKLRELNKLVEEQLQLGHIQPSTSPWNTPIFTIQKRSGKWRLLHDLRAVNATMEDMGALQPGLPSPTMLPREWSLLVIDLKDCFFSIPLHLEDSKRFAFSVPTINRSGPSRRYQWVVLPQGMKNSPTICQWYVDRALEPWRQRHPEAIVYHYMDDILVATETPLLEESQRELSQQLQAWGLTIAPEKIQQHAPWNYLGMVITETRVYPMKTSITRKIATVNDVQKLLGDIQWIRTYCGITNEEIQPLVNLLKNSKNPREARTLSPPVQEVMANIERKLGNVQAYRYDPMKPIDIVCYNKQQEVVGIIGQTNETNQLTILEWVFSPVQPRTVIMPRKDAVGELLLKTRQRVRIISGKEPSRIILPLVSLDLVSEWTQQSISFALATCGVPLDNHYPKHPLLHTQLMLEERKVMADGPIHNAKSVFTDASGKTKKYGYEYVNVRGEWARKIMQGAPEHSVQILELMAAVLALKDFAEEPLNLIVDSLYVAGVLQRLHSALIGQTANPKIQALLIQASGHLNSRVQPFWCTHVRSHSGLPGILAEGNQRIDAQVSAAGEEKTRLQLAQRSHAFFHQSARSLQKEFNLSRAESRAIVAACPDCAHIPPLQDTGTNPRGLEPRQLWQTDVTEVPAFGRLRFVHVSVDTFSKMTWATAATSTRFTACRLHWLQAFAALGKPAQIKTDNGPAYTSAACAEFMRAWDITHSTGVPYNSTGQAIVERRHQDLKRLFAILKKEGEVSLPVHDIVAKSCYVLNWRNLIEIDQGELISPGARHAQTTRPIKTLVSRWVPQTHSWQGPVELLTWGRGYACVIAGTGTEWIPAKWVRPWLKKSNVGPADDCPLETARESATTCA